MKFNTKTRYGLRTMLDLALYADEESGVYQKDISKRQHVTIKYLDQIISALKRAGLIENVGGKKSGYRLGRPAEKISIYDIFLAFEEELAIIDCLVEGKSCPRKKHCVLKNFWCELNENIRSGMESMNLGILARQHREATETLFLK